MLIPKKWYQDFVPDDFIEGKTIWTEGLPVALPSKPSDLTLEYSPGKSDWDWTKLKRFYREKEPLHAVKKITALATKRNTSIWMVAADTHPSPDESISWILVSPEVFNWTFSEIELEKVLHHELEIVLFIAADGSFCGSTGGGLSGDECWLYAPDIYLEMYMLQWPDWADCVFTRHPDGYWNDTVAGIRESGKDYCYQFFMRDWHDYVFDCLKNDSDETAAKTIATAKMLDEMGYYSSYQGLTVWDDLAIEFYKDEPQPWVLRLWQFMNPLSLWMDLTHLGEMMRLRDKAKKRDEGLVKRLKQQGKLFSVPDE